ncbi:MAG: fructose bisphosphate aldolase [Methylococcaceae bacterium TMED69]|nr:MAG: fructose bisphosphate aldolase [Methylococcaceae bacterium TMED69]|tara:strand:- start:840 stop:1733 length:894 start_codon:yes stop_codon:yes gene_type:complete
MTSENLKIAKIKTGLGFIAALDQSGGSTPKALMNYGIKENEWSSEEEMFELVHKMRERIVSDSNFTGKQIIGAILFERTMNSQFCGLDCAKYLWEKKEIVPFLKIDKGLADEEEGVQLMQPNPNLIKILKIAKNKEIFGTKMRSVIKSSNHSGIKKVVKQQFETAKVIINEGLVPIIEPEIDINCPAKLEAENMLLENLHKELDKLNINDRIMLKLTLPDKENFYQDISKQDNILRVVALSGGYPQELANKKLHNNLGVIASFSRALTEGLSAGMTDQMFSERLGLAINKIYTASIT